MVQAVTVSEMLYGHGLEADFFGCRIVALAGAYGLAQPFVRFWRQSQGAYLACLDGSAVLSGTGTADWEELQAFLPAAGVRSVLCDAAAAVQLPAFPVQADGVVLARMREGGAAVPAHELNPGPRELYSLLKQCETNTFRAPPFEGFYLDLSHRTRHGAAVSVAVRENGGELAACAFSTVQTASLAVISGVAVRPGCRGKGLGSQVVRALQAHLSAPRVCVYRARGENEAFYRVLGFQQSASFVELRVLPEQPEPEG